MTDTTTKKQRKAPDYNYVPSVFVKRLEAMYSTRKEAGAAIGVSDTIINDAVRDGKTRQVNELAAELIVSRAVGSASGEQALLQLLSALEYIKKNPLDLPAEMYSMLGTTLKDLAKSEG